MKSKVFKRIFAKQTPSVASTDSGEFIYIRKTLEY